MTSTPKRRVLRVQQVPDQWSSRTLHARLKESFPGHPFRIDALCKRPGRSSQTALITFDGSIPEVLLSLINGSSKDYELNVGDHGILFAHCLGLTTLSEPLVGETAVADILFIHGLGGHAIGSWTALNGKCWPRDFLGSDLTNVRVMTFGYEAKLSEDSSTSQLSDFGAQLLQDLSILRKKVNQQKRPLFLVGHSFGGTIIAWVLHKLSFDKQNPEYQLTLKAIRCATFFGTPHQGMSIQYLEPLTDQRSHDSMKRTLRDLASNSELLKILGDALRTLSEDLRFITCVEQKLTEAPSTKGQPSASYEAVSLNQARIFSRAEDVVRIHADHREMIKFSSDDDRHYEHILQRLRIALKDCRGIKNVCTLTTEQKSTILKSLQFPEVEDRQKAIKNAHETTCDWFAKTVEYENWLSTSKDSNPVNHHLWVHGGLGSGKSTIMKHISTQHRTRHRDHLVLAFFFDAQGTHLQTSAHGMYQTLLLQVLEGTERIPCESNALRQWIRGDLPRWTVSDLQEVLEYTVVHLDQPIFCYIDGFDELQDSDIRNVLDCIDRITRKRSKDEATFKACFSTSLDPSSSSSTPQKICLEKQQSHLQSFIRYIEHELHLGRDHITRSTYQMLAHKTSGNFVWLKIVVELLKRMPCYNRHSLQDILHELPTELHELYRHAIMQVVDESSDLLLALFQQMLYAKTPLTVRELYFMLLSHTNNISMDGFKAMPSSEVQKRDLLHLGRGLVEFNHARTPVVQFIHPSLKDFLHEDEEIQRLLRQQTTSPGIHHDRWKESCLQVIQSVTFSTPAFDRDSVENIKYAVEHVFHHANEAAKYSIAQTKFLETFPLAHWIQCVNTFSHHPRYMTGRTLLEVLDDLEMSALRAELPAQSTYPEPNGEFDISRGSSSMDTQVLDSQPSDAAGLHEMVKYPSSVSQSIIPHREYRIPYPDNSRQERQYKEVSKAQHVEVTSSREDVAFPNSSPNSHAKQVQPQFYTKATPMRHRQTLEPYYAPEVADQAINWGEDLAHHDQRPGSKARHEQSYYAQRPVHEETIYEQQSWESDEDNGVYFDGDGQGAYQGIENAYDGHQYEGHGHDSSDDEQYYIEGHDTINQWGDVQHHEY
ncbi:Nn.00g049030.m01.CDS01 [Neocucurbitaria sp. VM-36]